MRIVHIIIVFLLVITTTALKANETSSWLNFNNIEVYKSEVQKKHHLQFKNHKLTIIFITASWCISCQKMNKQIIDWEKKYEKSKVRFISLHVHETDNDFHSYIANNETSDEIYLANTSFIKKFKNPIAPAIILFDQFGRVTSIRSNLKNLDYLEPLLKVSTLL